MTYAASHSPIMRATTVPKKLTPGIRKAIERWDGVRLGLISKPVLYDNPFRYLKRSEHKPLIQAVLGGYMRVYRVSGPLPGEHPPSRIGARAEAHYLLSAAPARSEAHRSGDNPRTTRKKAGSKKRAAKKVVRSGPTPKERELRRRAAKLLGRKV